MAKEKIKDSDLQYFKERMGNRLVVGQYFKELDLVYFKELAYYDIGKKTLFWHKNNNIKRCIKNYFIINKETFDYIRNVYHLPRTNKNHMNTLSYIDLFKDVKRMVDKVSKEKVSISYNNESNTILYLSTSDVKVTVYAPDEISDFKQKVTVNIGALEFEIKLGLFLNPKYRRQLEDDLQFILSHKSYFTSKSNIDMAYVYDNLLIFKIVGEYVV